MSYPEGNMDPKNLEGEMPEEALDRQAILQRNLESISKVLSGEITPEQLAEELTRQELELRNLADRDDLLTEFYNKRVFPRELGREIKRAQRVVDEARKKRQRISAPDTEPQLTGALLALDVDEFKLFNDTFGHPAGDEALKTFARVIQKQTRDTDVRGRIGGDELAVFLVGCDNDQARVIGKRIQEASLAAIKKSYPSWDHTISIGISQLEENDTPEELRRRADQALYFAKERKGVVIHQTSIPQSNQADLP